MRGGEHAQPPHHYSRARAPPAPMRKVGARGDRGADRASVRDDVSPRAGTGEPSMTHTLYTCSLFVAQRCST